MIVLDFGSGETCQNNIDIVHDMIDHLAAVDTRRQHVIIKWQLFREVPANCLPLTPSVFADAVRYAHRKHYWTTASVFDEPSLQFLLDYQPPFVKIAARPELYRLLDKIPPEVSVFVSIPPGFDKETLINQYPNVKVLHCVPEYPANPTIYETSFGGNLHYSISDHTTDFYLYHKYQPYFYECHYKLGTSTGLDSGPFARTPKDLAAIL